MGGLRPDKHTLADEIRDFLVECDEEPRQADDRAVRLLRRVLSRSDECKESHDHITQRRCKVVHT